MKRNQYIKIIQSKLNTEEDKDLKYTGEYVKVVVYKQEPDKDILKEIEDKLNDKKIYGKYITLEESKKMQKEQEKFKEELKKQSQEPYKVDELVLEQIGRRLKPGYLLYKEIMKENKDDRDE